MLLVALSDNKTSSIALFDLGDILSWRGDAALVDHAKPLAEAFLHGPVYDGEVDLGRGGLDITLEIRARGGSSFEFLSLRVHDEKLLFTRLSQLNSVSHLRAFRGDWIGYSVHNDINTPTLYNRRTKKVLQLCSKLEIQGGCLAMTLSEDLAAVVFRKKLCLYRFSDSHGSQLIQTLCLDCSARFASIVHPTAASKYSSASSGPIFVLALGVYERTTVYHILPTSADECHFIFRRVWNYKRPRTSDIMPLNSLLGCSGSTISWLVIREYRYSQGANLCFATLPSPADSGVQEDEDAVQSGLTETAGVYELQDGNLPALYHMTVRDYDEVMGLAVIGNAFGELVVCDFSGTPGTQLDGCFHDIHVPLLGGEDIQLPKQPVRADPAYPLPLMECWERSRSEIDDRVLADWNSAYSKYPAFGVPYYNTNWKATMWFGCFKEMAWMFDEYYHLYGKVVPLARAVSGAEEMFNVGGLLVMFGPMDEDVEVVKHGLSPEAVLHILDKPEIRWTLPVRHVPESYLGASPYDGIAHYLYERKHLGLNRAAELKTRGGFVDDSWLTELTGNDGDD